jgi:hypothetical protein
LSIANPLQLSSRAKPGSTFVEEFKRLVRLAELLLPELRDAGNSVVLHRAIQRTIVVPCSTFGRRDFLRVSSRSELKWSLGATAAVTTLLVLRECPERWMNIFDADAKINCIQ